MILKISPVDLIMFYNRYMVKPHYEIAITRETRELMLKSIVVFFLERVG